MAGAGIEVYVFKTGTKIVPNNKLVHWAVDSELFKFWFWHSMRQSSNRNENTAISKTNNVVTIKINWGSEIVNMLLCESGLGNIYTEIWRKPCTNILRSKAEEWKLNESFLGRIAS